ncbi:putative sensor histidine kinase TcrY [Clostridium puniceum]|uniref:histidine kinase n=1 Tax=Clostridium puniceum TaxID=29367 RepID=A0A1S8TKQ6_9CLOT|nr:ATP-binding protein [Clostridium puniceum]OOM78373.1 putative sensor histidine kinase TcrY [Clostridium puniceum]
MNIIDLITSILQSTILAYTIFYCEDKNQKINFFSIFTIFLVITNFFIETFGNNFEISIFITHILCLSAIALVYRKNILSALTAFTITYFIIQAYTMLFGNLIFEYVKGICPIEYINYETIFIIYIPQWIVLLSCFKYIHKIKQIYSFIINEELYTTFLIISFILDFIINFYLMTLNVQSQLLKNMTYIIFFMFLISIIVYFLNIHKKSEQIYKLNKSLGIKNSELREIKNNYASQISYLYELGLMENFEDLKKSLKNIINKNESTPMDVEVSENKQSLLEVALKPAIDKGIDVIIEEKCDFGLIKINEMEIYRVITNIVNNAIKAVNGKGIIIAKSYEYLGNAVILLSNNGPKIEEHYLKDIFKAGFTTKDNADNSHGYGLSIVKDLVESHSGTIHVQSTDTVTEFKIILPLK